MISIDPNAIYTRSDLLQMFSTIGVNWDGLRNRVRPVQRIRAGYLGDDILQALRQAPALSEANTAMSEHYTNERKSAAHPPKGLPRIPPGKQLIGGIFDPDELGLSKNRVDVP